MSRAPARFRKNDVMRALRAAEDAGFPPSKVEIDRDGKICIYTLKKSEIAEQGGNEWDDV